MYQYSLIYLSVSQALVELKKFITTFDNNLIFSPRKLCFLMTLPFSQIYQKNEACVELKAFSKHENKVYDFILCKKLFLKSLITKNIHVSHLLVIYICVCENQYSNVGLAFVDQQYNFFRISQYMTSTFIV